MGVRQYLLVAVMLLFGVASSAWAGETGTISGAVFDQNGTPIAALEVRVSGEKLPGGRTVTTDENGMYNFPLLIPGTYIVEASQAGVGTSKRSVIVEVDRDSQLDLVLGLVVEEQISVVAKVPVVDLRSTEVNFNYSRTVIDSLPLERTYRGLFQLIPGVSDPSSTAGEGIAPAAGGGRQDNTFLVDGVNITNPGFGYLSTEVNELDFQEFNVKRGAITAEFGRASGFVTNAVTKSGGNTFTGTGRFELQPTGFNANSKDPRIRDKTDRLIPALALSGPLRRDKLFWYASARFFRSTTSGRSNLVGPLPDSEWTINEYLGKITAQPSEQHSLGLSVRLRPNERTNRGVSTNDSPEVGTDNKGTNQISTATWGWFIGDRTVLDVKYLHLLEENEDVALRDLGFRPTWNPNNLTAMGAFQDPDRGNGTFGGSQYSLNRANYRRNEIKATVTRYLDLAGTSHQLKVGFGWDDSQEDLTRKSNGWGMIVSAQNDTQWRARYYPEQPSQLSLGRTYSLFVQDDVNLSQRTVLNAGILLNRDEFGQKLETKNTFLTFNFFDEIQPRLGVNYNLRKTVADKLYVNYGRYYGMDQKSSARSLAPGRLFTNDAIFDRATGALISDTPGTNTTGKVIDPYVNPTFTDEVLFGYATPLVANWSVDVFYMFRTFKDFIEDFPRVLPASNFWYSNLVNGSRTYNALTVEVSRRLSGRWAMTASYGWSRLHGNFDQDYNGSGDETRQTTIFNTSSILQDGPGVFVEDPGRQGPLSQDRPHVLKIFTSYQPMTGLTVGGYLRSQSGTPWSAKGRDWYDGYNVFLEPAGTRRNDFWTNFDLLGSYRWPFSHGGLTISGTVLNLFDTQTVLFRDQRQYLDGRIRLTAPPYLATGTTLPNPRFGAPTEYALQRRFVMTFLVDF